MKLSCQLDNVATKILSLPEDEPSKRVRDKATKTKEMELGRKVDSEKEQDKKVKFKMVIEKSGTVQRIIYPQTNIHQIHFVVDSEIN